MFWASLGSCQCKRDLIKALEPTERSQMNHTCLSKSEASEKKKNLSCRWKHPPFTCSWWPARKGYHKFFFYYYQSRLPNLWANLQVCFQTITVTSRKVKMDCATVFTRVMIWLEQICNNCKILCSLTDKITTKSYLSSCKREKENTFPKIAYKNPGLPQKTWPHVAFSKAWILFKNNTQYIQ